MRLVGRWLALLAAMLGVSAGLAWFGAHPGSAVFRAAGYEVRAPLWLLALALTLVTGLMAALAAALASGRQRLRRHHVARQLRRRDQGLTAISDALIALSTSHNAQASRHLKQASRWLDADAPPVHTLLGAHVAAKTEDTPSLRQHLEQLRTHPQTRGLALRGLSRLALKQGSLKQAETLSEEAWDLHRGDTQAALGVISLLLRQGHYIQADTALLKARRHQALTREQLHSLQARLHYLRYRDDTPPAGPVNPHACIKTAFTLDPAFAPAAESYARQLLRDRKRRHALAVIEKAWKACPHPCLSNILLEPDGVGAAPADKLRLRVEKLRRLQPNHIESHIALARAGLNSSRWDLARNHLKAALAIAPQARVILLLAQLEEQSMQDEAAAAQWLKRMPEAAPDPAWICRQCGHHSPSWAIHCHACATLNGYRWEATPGPAIAPAASDLLEATRL